MDVAVVHELLEVVQVVPPLEEESVCDEAEPGCDLQLFALCLLQHHFQLLFAHIAVALDFIRIRIQVHVLRRGKKKKNAVVAVKLTDTEFS